MSNQLALSASLSVLMMSIYVLFGTNAAHVPLKLEPLAVPINATAPGLPSRPGALLPLAR